METFIFPRRHSSPALNAVNIIRQRLIGPETTWTRTDAPICDQMIEVENTVPPFCDAYYTVFPLTALNGAHLSKVPGGLTGFLSQVLFNGLFSPQHLHIKLTKNEIRIEIDAEEFRNHVSKAPTFAAQVREEAIVKTHENAVGSTGGDAYKNHVSNELLERGAHRWKCDRDNDENPIRYYHTLNFRDGQSDRIREAAKAIFAELDISYSYQLEYDARDLERFNAEREYKAEDLEHQNQGAQEVDAPTPKGMILFVEPGDFKEKIVPILQAYRDHKISGRSH